ncbi:conserved hypothetical protein [Clavispora lusitaniae ATCC 42720]|uniref:Uncharacterized protein n=1 Tax=Clavispora lusitaniae (strain ATCC 42720) TaxID=306902 RepID=C4Y7H1_CLAL4|nr:uncharacterized protein CLUG_04149 [Clavispora lusitaniae ATCC 42720]EEQ40022.1 conserved hypothetical protein [Clavispora lusitaniae ATCC 42720]
MHPLPFQMALASFNLLTNSSTESTLTPAERAGGSSTLSVSKRLTTSIPKSSAFNFSNGFFLAFMMLGNDAYSGSLSLKSVVMIIGKSACNVSAPPSTSSVTLILSPLISTLDAFVAWGQFNKPAKICPVWLASSSIDCLPKITKLEPSLSTTFCNILATVKGSTSASPTSTKVVVSAPLARAVLKISCDFVGPMETAWIFSTNPLFASSIFNDSSKAMSQNGLISNFTPFVSTPVPALLILGLIAKSMTLLTGTKIFNLDDMTGVIMFRQFSSTHFFHPRPGSRMQAQ